VSFFFKENVMALSKKTKEIMVVALADKKAATELAAAVDAAGNSQAAHVANVTAADATDLASAEALANANKAAINAILAALQAAKLMA
jgi:hypothetical protein